ncbi:MAG: hypothetical protein Q9191_007330, partial [Dirinaria sp. TL-2023a]
MSLANPATDLTLDRNSRSARNGSPTINEETMDDISAFNDTDSSDDGHPPSDKGKKRMGIVGVFRSSQAGKIDAEHAMRSPRWATQQRRPILKQTVIALCAIIPIVVLASLLAYYVHHLRSLIPHNDIQRILASWGTTNTTEAEAHYPTDFSRDIVPIPCHSHNDYWRKVPLYDALAAGCTGVEADVWLKSNDLFVGHNTKSLTSSRTLKSLYIDPLVNILSHQNPSTAFTKNASASVHGVFDTSPSTPLTLLIDMKTNGASTFPVVLAQLEPLRTRGWLTHFNGSAVVPGLITVVGTGNTPFNLLSSNKTYRDIFFDAPLDHMSSENPPPDANAYTSLNSDYASVSFAKAFGNLYLGMMRPDQ